MRDNRALVLRGRSLVEQHGRNVTRLNPGDRLAMSHYWASRTPQQLSLRLKAENAELRRIQTSIRRGMGTGAMAFNQRLNIQTIKNGALLRRGNIAFGRALVKAEKS
ncbi:MAG: hypothetical protein WC322_06570 [Candidatus Paceibacterota bacterium]